MSEVELRYGDPVFALNHANYLIKHYSAKAFGYRLLGDIYLKQKKFKPAIENFQTALKKDENTFHLIRMYSANKAAKADKKALTLVENWLSKRPQDVLAKEILADEYLLLGRYQKAKALYEKLIQNRPNRVDYLNNLAYIYLQLNDEKALSYAEKAQNLAPHVSSINDTYGWILVQSGQVEKGLRYLRFAYAKSSSEVEINYHIAVALYKQKRYQEARVELKNALAGGKAFNGRKDVEKLLDELNNLN